MEKGLAIHFWKAKLLGADFFTELKNIKLTKSYIEYSEPIASY